MKAVQILPLMQDLDGPQQTEEKYELLRIFAVLALQLKDLVALPPELNSPLSRIKRLYLSISDFSNELIHDLFRFGSQEQLRYLLAAFRFPRRFERSKHQVFAGEEIL